MHKTTTVTRSKAGATAARFLVQTLVYAGLVIVYYLLVLNFLGGWLKRLFDAHLAVYAFVALALIIAQGAALDLLTGWLFTRNRGKSKPLP